MTRVMRTIVVVGSTSPTSAMGRGSSESGKKSSESRTIGMLIALITSMSEDPKLQAGSPGRKEIFRTVQSIFERGYRVFDIGLSLNDEKRAWCNNTHRVTTLYFPRTPGGFIWSAIHRLRERVKYWIKADEARFAAYKRLRAKLPAAFR